MINFSYRKVGGLMFVKLGRFCFSFCITNEYRSLNEPSPMQRLQALAADYHAR